MQLIENNVKESSKILREQGLFYDISKVFNVVINNYTDSIIINEAYSSCSTTNSKWYLDFLGSLILPDIKNTPFK